MLAIINRGGSVGRLVKERGYISGRRGGCKNKVQMSSKWFAESKELD